MSNDPTAIRIPHSIFQELSALVSVKEDESRGRYIEALQDIPPGTVICNEIGIAFGRKPDQCSYCFRKIETNIHCLDCYSMHEKYYKYENPFRAELDGLGLVGLTVRVLLSFSPAIYEQHFSKDRHLQNCPFTRIFLLKRSEEIDDFTAIKPFLTLFQNHLQSYNEWKIPRSLFLKAFEEIFSRLKVNAHVVFPLCSDEDPDGTGIFPISSIFNHSCKANVFSFFDKNRFFWVSMGIRKGDEVLDNYGVQAHSVDYEKRKDFLRQRGFECKCKVCVEGPDDSLLIIPDGIMLPYAVSYPDVVDLIRNKALPYDHIALTELLQRNVLEGTDDAEQCFELLISNQFGRGVIFDPVLITQFVSIAAIFKDSKNSFEKVVDWLTGALFLVRLYCLNLHPRLEEIQQLLKETLDTKQCDPLNEN